MTSRCLIIFAITICLCRSLFVADGSNVKSNDVVTTIQTEDGVYDCVDFYKQPAFKHPLMKNHSFHPEMRPSSTPRLLTENEFSEEVVSMDIRLKGATCPRGTVPIRKFNKEDELLQTQLRRQGYDNLGNTNAIVDGWSPSNIYFAVGQSKSDVTRVYNGVSSALSVFNPHVEKYQYSSGEIIIKGGNDAIITGWTVNPMVYKDNQTRFFIYTISGDSHCMNSMCGFIQVNTDIPLDFPFHPVSTVEGEKYLYPVTVFQDDKNGNWWLVVGSKKVTLGFWPQNFFHGLYKSGSIVACGGEVYGPPEEGLPNMGSSYKPKSEFPEWSFCQNVKVLDESQTWVIENDLEPYSNNGAFYDVGVYNEGSKHYVFYGGPQRY